MGTWGTWLAQSEECATLDLRVVSLSPVLRVEIKQKEKKGGGAMGMKRKFVKEKIYNDKKDVQFPK